MFGVAAAALRRIERPEERERTRPWVLFAGALILGFVGLSALTELTGRYDLIVSVVYSARWLFFGVLVALALARHSFLGFKGRIRLTRRLGAAALAGAVAFLLVRPLLDSLPDHGGPFPAGSALAAAGGLIVGVAVLGRAAEPRAEPASGPDPLRSRKLEAYRALVEAWVEGGAQEGRAALDDHRRRLGLSAQDHESVVALVEAERTLGGPSVGRAVPPGFRLVAELPSGGTAWAAVVERDSQPGRAVLKVLRPEWRRHAEVRERFLREGQFLARVRHPNVVRVLETIANPPALLLEYAPGGNLAARVAQQGPLRGEALERLARDLLGGLDALHRAGVVHRDLKPQNILLSADERAIVADCGIARDLASSGTRLRLTVPGEQPGTVLYMAPEQVRGQPADARTDLYGLGSVLVFAATGRHYLGAEGLGEFDVKRRILEETPKVPATLPPRLRRLAAACLRKQPSRRPASARAAMAMLRRA